METSAKPLMDFKWQTICVYCFKIFHATTYLKASFQGELKYYFILKSIQTQASPNAVCIICRPLNFK